MLEALATKAAPIFVKFLELDNLRMAGVQHILSAIYPWTAIETSILGQKKLVFKLVQLFIQSSKGELSPILAPSELYIIVSCLSQMLTNSSLELNLENPGLEESAEVFILYIRK
jgi:hypothetical protein